MLGWSSPVSMCERLLSTRYCQRKTANNRVWTHITIILYYIIALYIFKKICLYLFPKFLHFSNVKDTLPLFPRWGFWRLGTLPYKELKLNCLFDEYTISWMALLVLGWLTHCLSGKSKKLYKKMCLSLFMWKKLLFWLLCPSLDYFKCHTSF